MAKALIQKKLGDFLAFVDSVSQPSAHGPTYYFKFRTVQMPKKNVPNYQQKVRRSIVGEFTKRCW